MKKLFTMLFKPFLFAAIATVATVSACASEPAPYKLEVFDFSKLKVTNGINVEYYQSIDSAGWAYFECVPEVASMLLFSNNKEKLNIELTDEANGLRNLPVVRVYSASLAEVENVADSTVTIMRNGPVPSFKANVIGNGTVIVRDMHASRFDGSIKTGSGHIVVNGTAQRVKLNNVGKGPIEAGRLNAETVRCTLLGTGNIDCTATEELSVYGAGSGKVFYTGNPKKIVNRSVGVKVVDMEATPAE